MAEIAPKILRTPFSNGEIAWKVFGKGTKIILAFHGFGQTGEAFDPLITAFPDHTIYAMDLPFHGASTITDSNKPLSSNQIIEIANNLIIQENIHHFLLIGFSIGVKLIFPLVSAFSTRIHQIVLIAPDGIKENFWYRFATSSKLMRYFFWGILNSKHFPSKIITFASALHLINSKTAIFVKASLSNREKKLKVYNTWCYLRKLKFDKLHLPKVVNEQGISITFVVGVQDRIIPKNSVVKFSTRIAQRRILELPGGHHDLIKQYSEKINVLEE